MNKNKFILLALLISIGINLLLVGGMVYRLTGTPQFSMGRPFPPNVGWMVRDLSEARQTELASTLEESAAEINPIRREMFEAQRSVNELMATENFDAEAVRQAFENLRNANMRYQALSHEQSISMMNELTSEERRIAGEFVNRRGPRDGRPRGEGRRGDDFGGRPPPADGDRPPPPTQNNVQ